MGVYGNGNDKKPRKAGKGDSGGSWKDTVFIRCELVKADEAELVSYLETGELSAERVEECVADGYRYGNSPDREHERFIATFTDKSASSPFFGQCLSASGATPADARAALLYKHLYKLSGDWGNASVRDVSRFG